MLDSLTRIVPFVWLLGCRGKEGLKGYTGPNCNDCDYANQYYPTSDWKCESKSLVLKKLSNGKGMKSNS